MWIFEFSLGVCSTELHSLVSFLEYLGSNGRQVLLEGIRLGGSTTINRAKGAGGHSSAPHKRTRGARACAARFDRWWNTKITSTGRHTEICNMWLFITHSVLNYKSFWFLYLFCNASRYNLGLIELNSLAYQPWYNISLSQQISE